MKAISFLFAVLFYINLASAADCGPVINLGHSPDHGGLVGFSILLSPKKVRITEHNSPNFVLSIANEIQKLEYRENYNFFVCLDSFTKYSRRYRGILKTYAKVKFFRIYRKGELLVDTRNATL